MNDVSGGGMAFTCHADQNHLYPGQFITIRFTVPRFGSDDSFNVENFVRTARIRKIESFNDRLNRIALEFTERLPFDPIEQIEGPSDSKHYPSVASA